jgi:hypothetical protein
MDFGNGLAVPLEDHRLAAFFDGPHERRQVRLRFMDVDADHSG